MPETLTTTPVSDATFTTDTTPDLCEIGIEFEYPVGEQFPPGSSDRSRALYEHFGGGNEVPIDPDVRPGEMWSDHTGAEIPSPVLDLHSNEPELWYAGTIDAAERAGFPFSRSGYGDTVFGLHMHLTDLTEDEAVELYEMCCEPWMKMFVCTSFSETSADPWRHGGASLSIYTGGVDSVDDFRYDRTVNGRMQDYRYEWRLPEPMHTSNLACVMHFLRLFATDGPESAREYGRGLVESRDDRLTSVQQYNYLEEHVDNWPHCASHDDDQTNPGMADYVCSLYD